MEFLFSTESEKGYIIETCKTNNAFHNSTLGCAIGTDLDGRLFHIFMHEDVTLSVDSMALYDDINFGLSYKREKYFDLPGYRFLTPIQRDIKNINDVASRKSTLLFFLKIQNEFYLKIKRNLKYDMDPQQLYDVIIVDGDIKFYRPIRLTQNRHAFILGQRQAFFELLKIFANSEECINAYKEKRKSIRERSICSASFFVSRNAPAELKCKYGSTKRNCQHISENSFHGKTLLERPTELCKFLLAQLLEDHDENAVNHTLGFSCCMVRPYNDNQFNDLSLVFAFNFLLRRTTHVHRLCLPEYLLTESWYEWLLKLIDVNV